MHKTGIEDYYVIKGNKKLRFGYTTGTCAAAASAAAARMLLMHEDVSSVRLMTPKGIELDLEILDVKKAPDKVSCAVRKDGGDDPDATNGILVYSQVSYGKDEGRSRQAAEEPEEPKDVPSSAEILIDGGTGVGRVTREGMQQAVGEAAINPVPRKMIHDEVEKVCRECGYTGTLKVIISIPEGVNIANKTFNPRLGIVGGISVLGTSGIVVPMSETALIASIKLEMEMLHNSGHEYLLVTPGNYGETFSKEEMTVDLSGSMKCSNYVGETLDMAVNMGIKGILFVAHVGKFVKVAGGIMNTHSKSADCRAELMAAFALRAGGSRELAMKILDSITTDEALQLMEEESHEVRKKACELMMEKIRYYLQHRVGGSIQTEAIVFSGAYGYLGETEGAQEMVEKYFAKK